MMGRNNYHMVFLVFMCLFIRCANGFFKYVPLCDIRRDLTQNQVKLCYQFETHMPYVIDASSISMYQCKKEFAGRRWNCTFPPPKGIPPLLHPTLPKATKESAYIHASTAAAIMHTVSRACMEGKLNEQCSCSQEDRPEELPQAHLWRGCGDNLPYGYKFSRKFTDAGQVLTEDTLDDFAKVLMNLHNNEAGRWAVFEKSRIQCRCHGVSKNCATKMCYRQLAEFKVVSKHLESLHQRSIHVELEQNGQDGQNTELKLTEVDPNFNKYSAKDLVYINSSPDYCSKNVDEGSYYSVAGRKCSKSGNPHNNCDRLCCRRGYTSKRQVVKEKCGCKFVWCCQVQCKTCEKEQNVHYCK